MGLKEFIKDRLKAEVNIEDYLNNLSPEDKDNIRGVLDFIRGQRAAIGGEILAIGSSVGGGEYKDIDLKVAREEGINCRRINAFALELVRSALGGEQCGLSIEPAIDCFARVQDTFRFYPENRGTPIHLVPSYRNDQTPDHFMLAGDLVRKPYVCLGEI